MQYAWAAENRLALWLDGALDPTSPLGAAPLGFPAPKYAEALAAAGLAPWEQRRAMALSGPALPMGAAVGLRPPLASPKAPGEEPPALNVFGLRRGTVPTYSPYVQERWELVEYVNSTVLDDVAQPVWRESSAAGELADVYGLSRLSTSGGNENLAIADTYLEDGLGSVSAVLREGGAVAASLSYSPWGEEELAMESLPGYGDRSERPHYGYNAEQSSPEGGLQYLRARWYDPSMGAFGSRDSLLGDAADPATLNRYAYAEGNPVAACDPTGHVTAYKNRLSRQRATQRRVQASSSRRTTSASKRAASSAVARVAKRTVLSVSSQVTAAARSAAALAKTPPLKKMTKELSYATNRTFKRVPARVDSVVVAESGTSLRYAGYYGGGKGGGGPGGFSPGTARTVALTASAIRARNYAAAARAAFCGTAAHMGESKTQGVDLAAIGHGALDLLGFIPGIGAAADVANGLWYAAEGNYVDAAASFLSAVPGVGDAFGGANAARKAVKSGLSAFEAAASPKIVGNVIKSNTAGTIRAVERPDKTVDLVLKRKDIWDEIQMSQATRKARDLSKGDTRVTPKEDIHRDPNVTKDFRENNSEFIPAGYDVDHVIDLQLGGIDHVSNLRPLDASVNRSMGAQIHYLIKDLPPGTKIGNVIFE